jgi:flagellar biosynthesis/type III secretory pathway protein FliH
MNLLSNLKMPLEVRQDINKEDRSFLMQLSPIYERDLAEAFERGVQQGLQEAREEGRRIIIENLLIARFGSLDSELIAIVQPILDLTPSELSGLLLQLANLSHEELLARFNSGS